jgi:hypothetical protein
MSTVGRAITSYLERLGWDVEQEGDEEIFSFAWQGANDEYHTVISVAPFNEPAMHAVMVRSLLPVEASKAHLPVLLDLSNRINVAFPYGNFVIDTISESYAVMAETQLFLANDALNPALFEQVLEISMEMAEFYQPAFHGIIAKKLTIDQALDLVLEEAGVTDGDDGQLVSDEEAPGTPVSGAKRSRRKKR